jgi:nitrile hydratase
MNGVHDVGGMHGFGPIRREEREPPFHAPWEGRVRAMMTAMLRRRVFNLDEMRRTIESIPPAQYLASAYYERWLAGLRMLLVEKGVFAEAEIDAVFQQLKQEPERLQAPQRRDNSALADEIVEQFRHPPQPARKTAAPRFRPGDRVVAKNLHVKGHTRLPRYVRGKQVVIDRVHGVYNLPDTYAHGLGENPEIVYSVRFAARELWGDAAAANHHLYIDLWESYLDAR